MLYFKYKYFRQSVIIVVYVNQFINVHKIHIVYLIFILFQLISLRNSVVSLLGLETTCPDYEVISRLTKLVNAHREFTSVSRRYDEPVTLPHLHPRTSPRYCPSPEHKVTPRYTPAAHDDSGYLDPVIDDFDSDINNIYNKRPLRTT